MLFSIVLAIDWSIKHNVSLYADFSALFSKVFLEFRKVDLSPKPLDNVANFYHSSLSIVGLFICNFAKSEWKS